MLEEHQKQKEEHAKKNAPTMIMANGKSATNVMDSHNDDVGKNLKSRKNAINNIKKQIMKGRSNVTFEQLMKQHVKITDFDDPEEEKKVEEEVPSAL